MELENYLNEYVYILFPDVEYITAELIYHTKIVTIHIKGINARTQLLATIKDCIRIYKKILGQVSR